MSDSIINEHWHDEIFQVTDASFNALALKTFFYQYKHNQFYNDDCKAIKVKVDGIEHYSQIPFLPIDFYKTHKITSNPGLAKLMFKSSGTTKSIPSKHYVHDVSLYEKSIYYAFQSVFGDVEDYIFLALLPNYLGNRNSSLLFMTNYLMDASENNDNMYYRRDFDTLYTDLQKIIAKQSRKKIILIGVAYALSDFAEQYQIDLKDYIVMETGGMKGRKKEVTRMELHAHLCKAFNTDRIYSEYAMTEILSQAYSTSDGHFSTPPWMKVVMREREDPFTLLPEDSPATGIINIIDLVNIHTCSFIATQDLGRKVNGNQFEVLGRVDNADIRGCSLLYFDE